MVSISQLGSIMTVFAHPDDESFTSGGLLALAAANGQTVTCVTATRGEVGIRDESRWPKEQLGEIRQNELEQSFKILGITNHYWLDYIDGQCDQADDDEAVDKVTAYINKHKPQTIITFAPDGLTGHSDHIKASQWANAALQKSGHAAQIYYAVSSKEHYDNYLKELDEKLNIYFNIDSPTLIGKESCDIALELNFDSLNRKIRSLKAQESQMDDMFTAFSEDFLSKAFSLETFVKADRTDIQWNKPKS